MTPPLNVLFTVPLSGGQELRVQADSRVCELYVRTLYGGDAMTAGAIRLAVADLKLVGHAIRYLVWCSERDEFRRRSSEKAA